MKHSFFKNVNNILSTGMIENIKIKNIDIFINIFKDLTLSDKLYNNFIKNYNYEYSSDDMLLTKTNDFMYRINLAINDWLIPIHKIDETEAIKEALNNLIDKGIDLYSAVSYDLSDMEIIEEFENILSYEKINI